MPTPEPVQRLSDAEVSKVGRLARLAIPENRIYPLRDQLAAVLITQTGSGVWISGVLSRWRASARGRTGLTRTRQDRRQ